MRLYGLIGYPLSHSFSKKYFSKKFEKEHIQGAAFENFSIAHIKLLSDVLKNNPLLLGLAVTIPYKKNIIPFLYEISGAVKKTGACNCIKITDGKLFGHNTDVTGFEKSFIKYLQPHHKKALILGTGGGAAAVEYVLQKLNIDYCFVSRKKDEVKNILSYDDLNKEIFSDYTIIINATPSGMYPNIDEAPKMPYQLLTSKHYLFDLIYNPAKTKFLSLGQLQGASIENGYEMLVLQAEENWKIWNK